MDPTLPSNERVRLGPSGQIDNPIVPLFLLKTFSILDCADPDVVSWSDEGDSFIVKNIDRFSEEVIPAHFKHNKFSSFVRQLNFYGFRKVKGKLTVVGATTCSWEFRHPCFLKGHPEFLSEIKRSSSRGGHSHEATEHTLEGENEIIERLMNQVSELNEQVAELTRSTEVMRGVIAEYQRRDPDGALVSVEELPDLGEDDLLKEFIDNDMESSSSEPPCGGLKRHRSIDDFSAMLGEPAEKTSKSGPYVNLNDPIVILNVANSIAKNMTGSEAVVSFDQYVSAVGAILCCASMSLPRSTEDAQGQSKAPVFDVREVSSTLFSSSL